MHNKAFICLGWSKISVCTNFPTLPFSKSALISTRKKHNCVIKLPAGSDTLHGIQPVNTFHMTVFTKYYEAVPQLPVINSTLGLTEPVLGDHCFNHFCLSKPRMRGQCVLWGSTLGLQQPRWGSEN